MCKHVCFFGSHSGLLEWGARLFLVQSFQRLAPLLKASLFLEELLPSNRRVSLARCTILVPMKRAFWKAAASFSTGAFQLDVRKLLLDVLCYALGLLANDDLRAYDGVGLLFKWAVVLAHH